MYAECPRSPEQREGCPYANRKVGCRSNTHHLMWPARFYETPIEQAFRELPQYKVQICLQEHDEAHYELPPDKPDLLMMLKALTIPLEGVEYEQAA